MTNRYAFHADESFVNPITREFQVVRVTENESGYAPVSEHKDLADAQWHAKSMNTQHGLSDQDVTDIRLSSMREHMARNDDHNLALWFTPQAIREHFDDADDAPAGFDDLDDAALREVASNALSDDTLYSTFHRVLVAAIEEVTGS